MADGNGYNGKTIPVTRELMLAWAFRGLLMLALPVAGYAVSQLLSKANQISDEVISHSTKLEIINDRITGVRETLQDHETRLRAIEHEVPSKVR